MPGIKDRPDDIRSPYRFGAPLDQATDSGSTDGLTIAQNVVYRPFKSISKRAGVIPYGTPIPPSAPVIPAGAGNVGTGEPVLSGVRWYRGRPSVLRQMLVQSNDRFWLGNDATGLFSEVGQFAGGSLPAYFARAYDAAESAVAGSPAADILIITTGGSPPWKWDGSAFTPLSPAISSHFVGCTDWHDHVWYWGPDAPSTLFASDLLEPEGWSFMTTNDGYPIGDGDGIIKCAIGVGASLLVFKETSVYNVTGFDFYTGEYPFTVTPLLTEIGTSQGKSVARMRSAIIWWTGQTFARMSTTDADPEPIGTPIVDSMALAAQNSQDAIRAWAGDVLVQGPNGPSLYTNVYLCAVDSGSGVADTVLMYDDDASRKLGSPAWTVLKGLDIGCFIPWATPGDPRLLFVGGSTASQVNRFGGHPTADQVDAATTSPIGTRVTSGHLDWGSPDQSKLCDRSYLNVNANDAVFALTLETETGETAATSLQTVGNDAGAVVGEAVVGVDVVGSDDTRQLQSVIGDIAPSARGVSIQFDLQESSATSAWSLKSLDLHYVREAPIR